MPRSQPAHLAEELFCSNDGPIYVSSAFAETWRRDSPPSSEVTSTPWSSRPQRSNDLERTILSPSVLTPDGSSLKSAKVPWPSKFATIAALASLNQPDAMTALMAERAFLNELGAGCLVPCGAYATVVNGIISLRGVMLSVDGSRSVRGVVEGDDPFALGRALAHELRDEQGGGALAGWQQIP